MPRKMIVVILLLSISYLRAQDESIQSKIEPHRFVIEEFNPVMHLEPLNQDTTSSCWSFATLSFIESEMVRLGKEPVKLAVIYPVYYAFIEKAKYYVQTKGESRFAPGDLFQTVFDIVQTYGIVPIEAYKGQTRLCNTYNHNALYSELDYLMSKVKNEEMWDEAQVLDLVRAVLNKHLGEPPAEFIYQGNNYTPASFRDEKVGLPWNQYQSITSFTYAPFDSLIILKVPDNWKQMKIFMNLPLDQFYGTLIRSLARGFSVAIDCDMSEPGRTGKSDLSVIPDHDIPRHLISQAARENRFENGATTDDHLMHIVGEAKTDEATWFLVKDSWRDAWEGQLKGYFIFHEDYVRLKVLAFMVHKDALKQ